MRVCSGRACQCSSYSEASSARSAMPAPISNSGYGASNKWPAIRISASTKALEALERVLRHQVAIARQAARDRADDHRGSAGATRWADYPEIAVSRSGLVVMSPLGQGNRGRYCN